MFRILLFAKTGSTMLIEEQFNTEAAAEGAITAYLQDEADWTMGQILRPIAEIAPVTTIQRRPLMPMGNTDG